MHHRHLLPNEIDLLLDEETGFGVQPLREHVRGCAECRTRLSEAQDVARSLAALPHLAPRFDLADRVMSQVPVFVPWHVSAVDAVRRWVPTGPVARAVAAVVVAVGGSLVTGLSLWLVTRGDLVAMLTGLVGEGARQAVTGAAGDVLVALFGPQVLRAVQVAGPLGVGLAAAGFVLASLATVLGLRSIATSGRARS